MKTIAVFLLCANGLIWPAAINGLCRGGGVTVLTKQAHVAKPRTVSWWI